ncbi:hypothetical protein [Nocardia sp. NPDC051463]|uniref:hypothetical protein n=1 Tax=Nocardia sp. NPDC051463 TaxID=3154845 RepID=UPI00344C42FD
MSDDHIDLAQRHIAADDTMRAALHAAARLAERLTARADPAARAAGVELADIILPALAAIGEVHP